MHLHTAMQLLSVCDRSEKIYLSTGLTMYKWRAFDSTEVGFGIHVPSQESSSFVVMQLHSDQTSTPYFLGESALKLFACGNLVFVSSR